MGGRLVPRAPGILALAANFLHPIQGPGDTSERLGLDTQALQDGNKELRQREFFRFYLASPSGIGNDTGTGLVVFISLTELEIPAIVETKILTTGRNDRIVTRQMKAAGSRTMHGKRVIQHVTVTIGFRRILQFLHETPEFLGLVPIIGTEVFPAIWLLNRMRQAMGTTKTNRPGQQIVGPLAIFSTQLEGGNAR